MQNDASSHSNRDNFEGGHAYISPVLHFPRADEKPPLTGWRSGQTAEMPTGQGKVLSTGKSLSNHRAGYKRPGLETEAYQESK